MRGRNAAVIGGIILLAIIILAYISFVAPAPTNRPSSRTVSSSAPPQTSDSVTSTTLEDLIAGKFPTASDKRGTGGVTVKVRDLQVLYVRTESDGDWHVAVTDGVVAVLITEITPAYQDAEGMPPVGSRIDETGIAYCDTVHETESWHGNTCWEIHPIMAWQPSGKTSSESVNSKTIGVDYSVTVTYGQDPIPRGSNQTITTQVRDSDGPVRGMTTAVEVDYASGLTVRNFSCVTSSDGICSISWEIGPTSTPGTFNVIIEVSGQDFESSFSVTE